MVQRILEKIEKNSLHPQVSALKTTLLDFVSGAPARMLVLAFGNGGSLVGAMTYVADKDDLEIKSLGVISGDSTAFDGA